MARVLASAPRRGRRPPAAAGRHRRGAGAGTSARCGRRPTPTARSCAASTRWDERLDAVAAFAETSRSVTLAAGQGLPGEVWQTGQPGLDRRRRRASRPLPRSRAADAAGLRSAFAFPIRGAGKRARRHGVLRRRARRARRRAAGHDDQPRVADRPVRRALPRRAGRARERRAQDRDPQRRLRLHRHDGRRRAHRRGQRGDRDDVRLQRRGDGRPRAGGAHDPARHAARGPPPRPAALHGDRRRADRRPPGRAHGHARRRQHVPRRAGRHAARPARARRSSAATCAT